MIHHERLENPFDVANAFLSWIFFFRQTSNKNEPEAGPFSSFFPRLAFADLCLSCVSLWKGGPVQVAAILCRSSAISSLHGRDRSTSCFPFLFFLFKLHISDADFGNIYLRNETTFDAQEQECNSAFKKHKQCPNDPKSCKPLSKTQYCGGANQPCNATKQCLPICWSVFRASNLPPFTNKAHLSARLC